MTAPEDGRPPGGNRLERACGALAQLALVAMLAVIGLELVLRNTLHWSWEGTDEVGAYLLVAVTFLSLATSYAHGGFHELVLVKDRLSPRSRAWLDVVMQVLCLACALALTWFLARTVYTTWTVDERSLTALRVPLWVPRLTMPLGTAALSVVLVLAILRRLRVALGREDRA